ncbi:PAC2 family protein [Candidatus Tiddalikarchaeum anstoanum]|nr:PAC2 family protein [Candidatus Tiddalikarchaeum anstoanum]
MKIRDRLSIRLIKNKKITGPTFVIGFQGVGLVGAMAAQHLADHLKCELIGHIESEYLPPIAILDENSVTFPIRVYYNKQYNLVIISSEVPVSGEFAFEMSHDILELIKEFKAKRMFVLEGLVGRNEEEDRTKVYGVPTNEEMKKFLIKNDVKIIKNGAILGVAGSMLLMGVEYGISSCALMAESHVEVPDALAASSILKKLGEMLHIKIDTEELEKKGTLIEKKIKKLLETMKNYKTSEDSKVLYG